MGYMKISNLYKDQKILLFKECYALEKIEGTSTHITLKKTDEGVEIGFFSGGAKHDQFVALFDQEALKQAFLQMDFDKIVVNGEGYGGKIQGMSHTYGPNLKFVAFDVRVVKYENEDKTAEYWLTVPEAEKVVIGLGLEFVAYNRIPAEVEAIDRERDLPSRQAVRNGITEPKIAEGVVLRPLIELEEQGRIISKHKRPEFSERTSKRDTKASPEELEVLTKAEAIADEWVTKTRLEHVLSKLRANFGREPSTEDTRQVINAMVEDVTIEGAGEAVMSKEAIKAVSTAAAKLFMKYLRSALKES